MLLFATDKAMVLKHHPDKRKAAGEQIVEGDNDYFTCITKGKFALSHCLPCFYDDHLYIIVLFLSNHSNRDPIRSREASSI